MSLACTCHNSAGLVPASVYAIYQIVHIHVSTWRCTQADGTVQVGSPS